MLVVPTGELVPTDAALECLIPLPSQNPDMSNIRSAIPLVTGLAIGVAGAILFIQSMPPPKGSAQEKLDELGAQLKTANTRIATLEASDPRGRRKPGKTFADGARGLAEDFRDGKAVTPDDILRAMQPVIRDLSPVFERMRARDMQRESDKMVGELARKYSLNASQQASLKTWLDEKAEYESKRYFDVVSQEGATLEDMAEASKDIRLDDGLDKFMEGTLSGEKLATFKTDRMTEKVNKVQAEADTKVERLNGVVTLDDAQRGQVFGLMARGAKDFDPGMSFEGLGTDTAPLATGRSKQDAILAVLRPDQKAAYEAEREKRREAARKDLEEIGLSLPENFDPMEQADF